MNRKHLFIYILCLMAAVPFLSTSCSSKKAVTKTSLREFTARQLIKEVDDNAFDYENMIAKISVKVVTNDKNISIKGQLRMQKDSIIWTSLSLPLGLEVLRVKVSTDSVYFLNRNDKTYLCENIEVFGDISPLLTSLPFIQSVLVGNDINLRESDDYKLNIDGEQYNLFISKSLKKSIKQKDDEWKVMLKDIWIDPQLYKITKYNIREYNDNKRKIELQYSDFQLVGDKYLPTKISIDIHGDHHLKADITYSNVIVNDNIDFLFNVPKKYERIFR